MNLELDRQKGSNLLEGGITHNKNNNDNARLISKTFEMPSQKLKTMNIFQLGR